MHDYLESHYIGDTSVTPDELECWLQLLSTIDYKQEDPLDPAYPHVSRRRRQPRGLAPCQPLSFPAPPSCHFVNNRYASGCAR
jgi:hypothetical protein